MISVLIIDDHDLLRNGLKNLIELEPDMRIAAEAGTAAEAMDILRSRPVDITILDLELPDKNGLEVLKDIKNESIDTAVLVLSMHPERRWAKRLIQNGARGYLTKVNASEKIVTAIKAIYTDGHYITHEVSEVLFNEVASTQKPVIHARLSDREFEVFILISQGQTVRQISEHLTISINTVNTYRRRIYEKTGLTTSEQIIKYSLEQKLI